MENLFLSFWNRSVAAGWLILAVIILRLALKRAPKSTRRLLWGLVGLRLLCPFSVQSALSLIPSAETIPQAALDARSPRVDSGLPFLSAPVNDYLGDHIYEGVTRPVGYTRGIAACCAALWLIGMALLLLWALVSWLRLRRRVAEAVPEGDGVWLCGQIDSPFLPDLRSGPRAGPSSARGPLDQAPGLPPAGGLLVSAAGVDRLCPAVPGY